MIEIPVHSGKTMLAGVVGWPVSHSLSPRLHGYWLNQNGIDGAYIPLAIHPDHFSTAIKGLAAANFKGVNVTVPHKEAAAALCDTLDEAATKMGAANTLVFSADGTIHGSNTDGLGFMENIRASAPDWQPSKPALIIGAGGAARAIGFALQRAGCGDIRITNRTNSRASEVSQSIGPPSQAISWEHRNEAAAGCGIVINTTTQGMIGHNPLDLDVSGIETTTLVTDIVYNPLMTPLLAAAKERGCLTVDGLGMLLHQAKPGFQAWFGQDPVVDEGLRSFVLAGL